MSVTRAYETLRKGLQGSVRRDEPLARHTTYRIGGPADIFVVADTVADLSLCTKVFAQENIDWMILGKGSNVLVADRGYRGAVIILGRDFRRHEVGDGYLKVGAGVALGHVVQDVYSKGLSGLEFAVGIPGTVGGALAMNAGTREEWIGAIVESVTVYVPGEGLVGVRGPEVAWGYRCSDIHKRGIVAECSLRVQSGDTEMIRRKMDARLLRRKRTQPLGLACAGSVFVNPEGDSAGRLIEASGLKGHVVGGAKISEIHANFIVNVGGASARDVLALVHLARDAVKDRYGIELRPEIRFLGSYDEA